MSSSDTLTSKANATNGELAAGGINLAPVIDGRADSKPFDAFDRFCGNCGYQLTGLPREGICPECGETYQSDELVICGWAAGPNVEVTTAAPKGLWRIALFSIAWIWVQALSELFQHRTRLALLLAAGGAALLCKSFYRRRALINEAGYTCHLRITPKGLAQREGFGPVKLVPWLPGLRITLAPEGQGMYLLAVSRVGPSSAYRKGKTQWPIAFQFECSPEKAAALGQILRRYDRFPQDKL